ncbi:MAG: bifunctional hydroxymethylpyrimidine kinase/phosphomethylpyrimidine kinase [Vampirovibrio sp.]|nr:bifunctional hydroxymethylpyrimidine kinase/phosphomethylpyrimidine kinase [Vampirovibrio sp.]
MKTQLSADIQRLNQGRVLVVGDVAIDEMTYGPTDRLSREAPVIILRHDRTDIILGAAGNAVHNIAKLGAKRAAVVGVSGKDYYCTLLLDALERDGIDATGLVQDESRPTTTKTRISGVANHSVTQQIVRIDRESRQPVSAAIENKLLDNITQLAPEFDAILLSDYDLGVMTQPVIDHCRVLAQKHGLVLAVDSQKELSLFGGATIMTPNQPEAEKNLGHALDTVEKVEAGGKKLLQQTGAQNLLITRSSEGMSLFESAGPETPQKTEQVTHIPVFNRSDVFDVTGAGDTVVGTLTLAMATGANLINACVLGNLAASIVVTRFGSATTSTDELQDALTALPDEVLNQISAQHAAQPK